jgi:nitrate reductase delta subunit
VKDDARRAALQAASLLLHYPDERLDEQLPLLAALAPQLPAAVGAPLARAVTHLGSAPAGEAQGHYVDTFDLRRRCCLYLTYYAFGDTRKRGMALLRFTHAYKTAGWELVSEELPDHLSVVCEFAATADLAAGLALLAEHRAGVELMRMALAELASPYADVLDVVRFALPQAAPRDLERALELARTGPPEEEVGLEPFAPPEAMGARR